MAPGVCWGRSQRRELCVSRSQHLPKQCGSQGGPGHGRVRRRSGSSAPGRGAFGRGSGGGGRLSGHCVQQCGRRRAVAAALRVRRPQLRCGRLQPELWARGSRRRRRRLRRVAAGWGAGGHTRSWGARGRICSAAGGGPQLGLSLARLRRRLGGMPRADAAQPPPLPQGRMCVLLRLPRVGTYLRQLGCQLGCQGLSHGCAVQCTDGAAGVGTALVVRWHSITRSAGQGRDVECRVDAPLTILTTGYQCCNRPRLSLTPYCSRSNRGVRNTVHHSASIQRSHLVIQESYALHSI